MLKTLILGQEEIFFIGAYQSRINSPIVTTGNELIKEEISDFSSQLSIEALYEYARDVKNNSDAYISNLEYSDLKRKFTDIDK